MKTIWKYQIGMASTLEVPKDAKLLAVQTQNEEPCLWFEVDPNNEKEPRKFHVIGTGHEVRGNKYLGTFQSPPFVWHVYEDSL